MKVGFFLLGKKGLVVLESVISTLDIKFIEFVIIAQNPNLDDDSSIEIKELCISNNIKYYERLNKPESIEKSVDYTFSIGWRWMIDYNVNLIVLHDSLLPKYRGFSPLANMLINKEEKLGVTALFATSEYDKGDIIEQKSINISYPIKIAEAIDKISVLYSNLVLNVCSVILLGKNIISTPQDENNASYSIWRDEEDYLIDWSMDAEYIARFVDSVSAPFAGASCFIKERKLRVIDVELYTDVKIINRIENIGKCIFIEKNRPVIICGKGLLRVNVAHWDNDKSSLFDTFNFRSRLTSTLKK